MEQVDRAIRQVHGGYQAVAIKLELAPPQHQSSSLPHNRQPDTGRDARASASSLPRTRSPEELDVDTCDDAARMAGKRGTGCAGAAGGREPPPLWGGKLFESSIPATKNARFYEDPKNLRVAIEEVVRHQSRGAVSSKTAMKWMPTERQLLDNGLDDAVFAIKLRHGGMHAVARKLGLRVQGPGARAERAFGCA